MGAGSGLRASSVRAQLLHSRYQLAMANELILIVEDNEKNRKLVRDVLQGKGYKTIETETGEEGIRMPTARGWR